MVRVIKLVRRQVVRRRSPVSRNESPDSADALSRVIAELRSLASEEQQKILETAATFFGLQSTRRSAASVPQPTGANPALRPAGGGFSEPRDLSPKEFLLEKNPRTDVERVTCLAFYLAHYRDTPHFKALDINKLNTEAAQSKMSNVHVAVDNATRSGHLVPAGGGAKQISAAGELFVQALPDREAAKAAISSLKPRKRSRKPPARPRKRKAANERE
jgi:hypothetical protein